MIGLGGTLGIAYKLSFLQWSYVSDGRSVFLLFLRFAAVAYCLFLIAFASVVYVIWRVVSCEINWLFNNLALYSSRRSSIGGA